MSLTAKDLDDGIMEGEALFEEDNAAVEKEYTAPMDKTRQDISLAQLRRMWERLSPQVHAAMQAANPEGYAELKRKLGG